MPMINKNPSLYFKPHCLVEFHGVKVHFLGIHCKGGKRRFSGFGFGVVDKGAADAFSFLVWSDGDDGDVHGGCGFF